MPLVLTLTFSLPLLLSFLKNKTVSYAVTRTRNSQTRMDIGELRGYAVTVGLRMHARTGTHTRPCAHTYV